MDTNHDCSLTGIFKSVIDITLKQHALIDKLESLDIILISCMEWITQTIDYNIRSIIP